MCAVWNIKDLRDLVQRSRLIACRLARKLVAWSCFIIVQKGRYGPRRDVPTSTRTSLWVVIREVLGARTDLTGKRHSQLSS